MTARLIVTSGANRGAQFTLADRIIFNIGSDRGSRRRRDERLVVSRYFRTVFHIDLPDREAPA